MDEVEIGHDRTIGPRDQQCERQRLLYGVMYLILSAEDQALLMGSVLAFVAVAATMWGTRHEDWGAAFGALKLRGRGQVPAG